MHGAEVAPRTARSAVGRRRAALATASAAGLSVDLAWPRTAQAEKGEVDEQPWDLKLPERPWRVKKEYRSSIRVKKELLFEAADPRSGATVTLKRTPIGSDARMPQLAGSFDPGEQRKAVTKETVVSLLMEGFATPAARRQRQLVDFQQLPVIQDYNGAGGQRYVQFAYDVQRCSGRVTEFQNEAGKTIEDCDGSVTFERHYATATVMPTKFTSIRSDYEESRFVECLWLLDAMSPDEADKALNDDLSALGRSFSVEVPKDFTRSSSEEEEE